jgi:hypothetical protein
MYSEAVPETVAICAELIVGVVSVGDVPSTTAPEPVEVVTPVPPEATAKAFANVTTWAELIVTAVVGVAPV